MKLILSENDVTAIKAILDNYKNRKDSTKRVKKLSERFFIDESNNLFYKDLTCEQARKAVAYDDEIGLEEALNFLHGENHIGMTAMYKKFKETYIGFKRTKIYEYVSKCIVCQQHTPLKRSQAIKPILSSYSWERVEIDCVDLRKYQEENDGYGWLLNVLDTYSKFMFIFPMKTKSAQEVVKNIRQLFYSEGFPKLLQSDNDKEFVNQIMAKYLEDNNVLHIRGRPRHPQNQGQVERANQTIVRMVAKALTTFEVTRWIDVIKDSVFCYNTTWRRSTNNTLMKIFRGRSGINNLLMVNRDI